MLVVHCDSVQLKRDLLHLGPEVELMKAAGRMLTNGKATIEVIDGTNRGALLMKLAALGERRFDVVLLIGHSNASGLRIASEADVGFVGWNSVPEFIRPFAPRRLILAACEAGRWPAAKALFQGLESLQEIIACPVSASKSLARTLIPVALFALDAPLPKELMSMFQGIGVVLGSQIRHWERSDMNDPSGHLLDPFSDLIQPGVVFVSEVIAELFRNDG